MAALVPGRYVVMATRGEQGVGLLLALGVVALAEFFFVGPFARAPPLS